MKKLTTTKRLERLTERYMNGGMDRRTFLGLAAAAATTATAPALSGTVSAKPILPPLTHPTAPSSPAPTP